MTINNIMIIINKYTQLGSIRVGDYIDDRRGKKGEVKKITVTSLAWGIRYDFKLSNGLTITQSE